MTSAGIRSIARNTTFLTLSRAIGIAARTVYVILVARLLGPDLYAVLAYSQAWYLAFLPFAVFGLGRAMVWTIAPDRERAAEIAASALMIRLLTTAVAAMACLALSRVFAPDPRALPLIVVLTVGLVARAVAGWGQHLFVAFESTQYTLRQEAFFRVLDLIVAVAVLTAGGGLLALVIAQSATWCLQAARALYLVRRDFIPLGINVRPERWWPLMRIATPFFAIALMTDWRLNGTLVLFRNLTGDSVLFGQFALAMQALIISVTVPSAVTAVAQPVLRRSVARGDGRDLAYASAVQRAGLIGGASAGIMGLGFGEPVFRLVFGDDFAVAGKLVGLTIWCLLPIMVGNAFPPVLIARGQFRAQIFCSAIGVVAMLALMFLFAPTYGAYGAIAAVFAGFLLPSLMVFTLACRQGLAAPGRDLFRPLLAIAAGLSVFLYAVSWSPTVAAGAGLATLLAGAAALRVVVPREIRRLRASL